MVRAGIPFALAAALLAAALLTPLACHDRAEGLTDEQVRALQDVAATSWQFQPLPPAAHLQVTEVRDRRSLGFPPTPEATVVWRTIFGVAIGETEVRHQGMDQRWHLGRAAAVWGAFLAAEAGLCALGGRALLCRARGPWGKIRA